MLDVRFDNENCNSELKNTRFTIRKAKRFGKTTNPVKYQLRAISLGKQQSTINNQQSTINNQQSTINNQQSTINIPRTTNTEHRTKKKMAAHRHNHTAGHGAVPIPTLRRLPGYLNYFKSLKINNVETVSSSRIANVFKMDATLVTKDLSYTGVKGRTKIGYNVDQLIESIISFLDFNNCEEAFLFGVGNLGRALINYEELKHYGITIIAGFDIDSKVVNTTIKGIKIYDLDDFRDLSQKYKARIAIITAPEYSAQEIADLVVAYGINAIWNFSPHSVKVPENIIVENTSLYGDLAVLLHRLNY